jgi:endoglucanase
MIKRFFLYGLALLMFSCNAPKKYVSYEDFIKIDGPDLLLHGERFFIKGTNLGNWLNPEGYMFGFRKTNSAGWIDRMFCELAGPDFTAEFWKTFKDRYITHADIAHIASTGANTIRLPFHYKLFTDEDYMGLTSAQDGFDRIDSVVAWCRREGLHVILDMHDAPGGQTGDNIDDSHGYPWLFGSETSQQLFCEIWVRIAEKYKNEPVILGYDLLNEPIAPYFDNKDSLNTMLEPLYKRAVAEIRKADTNHIVILGAPQWNSNFDPFTDWTFDKKIMYSCHRYGGDATAEAITHFIDFRDKTGLPMYMGEIGHNTLEWMEELCKVMEDNNIGYTFWPYKKMEGSCFVSIGTPENWDQIVAFSEAPRDTYAAIREARPHQELSRLAMTRFLELCLFENCNSQEDYTGALRLDKERTDN